MKKLLYTLLLCLSSVPVSAAASTACSGTPSLFKKSCLRLHQIWNEGHTEVYLPFYAWHNRYAYTEEKLSKTIYNEKAWGFGLGKGFDDEDGDWHGLYAMAFLDSHNHVQPIAGYAFLKTAHIKDSARLGLGYSVFLTQRSDIFNGYPFPGAAPWISIGYRQASLSAAYVPGGTNIGNVLFIFAKWSFEQL
ncbi:lipid IV(A) palmitoyltransferase PagP [Legionella spiritensis]|uniref:lipid IV(A) palmitoyltransferase PagP n=1 Tax=Legionella spiritensis TaxID=452 RepID=UPI000F71CE7E|nr:lipid IV(A) palmitoyltransferase PagP [Legionella spiritensis]VEG91612.1 Rcp protein, confers resistance to cationic antimicrobial peptides and promotes intracellular infection [Legionella spiritensis]